MTGQVPTPLSFLEAVQGYTEGGSRSSADRPIRLAVVDPAYAAFSTYPAAPPPARVTFEGESTLSTKAYGYVSGFIPWPGLRVFLVPIGNTYVIGGAIQAQSPQGFWQNAAGTESGVEFGGGSYYDTDEGLVIAGDASISGDLSVTGVGARKFAYKPSATGRTVTTNSADPHLTMTLGPGDWLITFDLIIGAANGDIKTAWSVAGQTFYTLKTCWGPSPYTVDTTTADETQGRDAVPMRTGVHQYGTDVVYGLNSASFYSSAWERGMVRITTSGTVALHWAQETADVPTPTVIAGGSYMIAERVA